MALIGSLCWRRGPTSCGARTATPRRRAHQPAGAQKVLLRLGVLFVLDFRPVDLGEVRKGRRRQALVALGPLRQPRTLLPLRSGQLERRTGQDHLVEAVQMIAPLPTVRQVVRRDHLQMGAVAARHQPAGAAERQEAMLVSQGQFRLAQEVRGPLHMASPNRLLMRAGGLCGAQVQLPRLQGSDLAVGAAKHDAGGEALDPAAQESLQLNPRQPRELLTAEMNDFAPRSSDGEQAGAIGTVVSNTAQQAADADAEHVTVRARERQAEARGQRKHRSGRRGSATRSPGRPATRGCCRRPLDECPARRGPPSIRASGIRCWIQALINCR